MQRPSLTWAFAAAILVGAVTVLGLLASAAAAAVPAAVASTAAAAPVATASAPASAVTSATDVVTDGNDGTGGVSNGAGAIADPNGGGAVVDANAGGGVVVKPNGGGVVNPGSGPLFPGLYTLQATAMTVTVGWYDRSTDEQKFVLYRRDAHGAFQKIYEVPTRNMAGDSGDFSYVDTDRSLSGQCYVVAAVNEIGAGYTGEECTVRPDASRFPQNEPPDAVQQWSGLSSVNDGTGILANTKRSENTQLTWSHQTFGVDLDWSTHSLWKIEAQGGPHLMRGQAVALRVWGGGWLTYGHETWGVDLQLSDTPSYEWYVLGGRPGIGIDSGPYALWNSERGDYLVYSHQTWGIDLDWYQNTLPPPPPPPPPPPQGVKTYIAYNCISEERPLEMWVQDLSAGTPFVDMGRLDSQWAENACPRTGQPWTFTPTPGHQYLFRAVDYSDTLFGCTNDPTLGACWRAQRVFVGDANGVVVNDTLG